MSQCSYPPTTVLCIVLRPIAFLYKWLEFFPSQTEWMDPAMVWFLWGTKSLCFGAISFQVLELFQSFIDEVEYIWRGRIRLISYLYAFSRYFPLVAQIVNVVFSEKAYASPTYRMCMASNIIKGASSQMTGTCVEAIQMIRVHALYNRSHRAGNFLLGVFVVGSILEVTGTVASIVSLEPGDTDSLCLPSHCSMWTLSVFIAGFSLIQGVLLFMTVSKASLMRGSTFGIPTPIISLLLRDGITFFVVIIAVIASITGFEVVRGLNESVFVWNVAFSVSRWYLCLLSVAGCRMILSIRTLGSRPNNQSVTQDPTLTQFSTIIDFSDSIGETVSTNISEMI